MIIFSVIGIIFLVGTHLLVDRLNLTYIPRSKWLSAAGGISVAYVFIQILPELKEWEEVVYAALQKLSFFENHIYLFALLGLVFFYGLQRAVLLKKPEKKQNKENLNIFWIHVISFCIYNFLIGYLILHREKTSLQSLVLYVFAMGTHFMVNDYGLLGHFKEAYKKTGRWLISGGLILGWIAGIVLKIPQVYIGIIFAFIAGGVIMNVLKEELPSERKSNYWAFLFGVTGYTILLIFI